MKDDKNKEQVVRITGEDQDRNAGIQQADITGRTGKLKKGLIFTLMGIVFIGCLYLIFKPAENKNPIENTGLNDAVPEATGNGLPADKEKAYQQEMLEQKMQEKREALLSLSDYWNESAADNDEAEQTDEYEEDPDSYGSYSSSMANPALNSYRKAQNTLNSFYDNNDDETRELRRQLDELKDQLAEQRTAVTPNVADQLALMEKSYQMAAKYLPQSSSAEEKEAAGKPVPVISNIPKDERFVSVAPAVRQVVSALHREQTDSVFLAEWSKPRNLGFYTAGVAVRQESLRNAVRAVVRETRTLTAESFVRLRLLDRALIGSLTIPEGSILTAAVRFENGRLQLKVTSVEISGNIIPVELTAYDLDGQPGLYVPASDEAGALTEIAANMGRTSGTSIMLTGSAGQQIAGDLSKGVLQGVSGYFSKRIRTPKVTLKAGHLVFLVSGK